MLMVGQMTAAGNETPRTGNLFLTVGVALDSRGRHGGLKETAADIESIDSPPISGITRW